MWAIVTSAVYPLYVYMVSTYFPPANLHPHPRWGVIISKPKTSFLGVVLDGDHDFEGPRAPKAHLGTVKYKPVETPGHPPYRLDKIQKARSIEARSDHA